MNLLRKDKAMRFMRLALVQAAEFSKDGSRKVAALIISPTTHEIRSSGYNGMPRGCDDNVGERLVKPEKLFWFEHAERNAIYNAARVGTPLEGSLLLATMFPCMDCARGIVQAGITGVIVLRPSGPDGWSEHFERSMALFKECGVAVEIIDRNELIESANPEMRDFFRAFFVDDC